MLDGANVLQVNQLLSPFAVCARGKEQGGRDARPMGPRAGFLQEVHCNCFEPTKQRDHTKINTCFPPSTTEETENNS